MATTATETNKRVIEDAFTAIGDGRLDELEAHPGFWETRQVIPAARRVFTDWRTAFMEQIAEGERVFTHFAVEFTHAAPLAGVPATARRVTIEGFSLDHVAGGVVVEHNSTTSWADVLRQLAVPGFEGWPPRQPRLLVADVSHSPGAAEASGAGKAAVAWLLRALGGGEEPGMVAAGPGVDGLRREFTAIRAAFPDLSYSPAAQIAEDDRVAMRGTLHGTHTGPLFGFAPTGKLIVWDVFVLARVRAGSVIALCGSHDWNAVLGQLGLFPDFA